MDPRFLITGGTGFLGREVLAELSRRGIETHVLSRNPPSHSDRTCAEWHRIDLLVDDPRPLLKAARPTHCLHLAWVTTPGSYRQARENYDWVTASLRLGQSFFDAGGLQLTMAGSCTEYIAPATEPCHELSTPLGGDCAYAICKLEAGRLLGKLARDRGAIFNTGRIFYAYGPGEPPGKLVRTICEGLLRQKPIPLTSGLDRLDFVYVSDIVAALLAVSLSGLPGPFNIGSGCGHVVRDVATCLARIARQPDLLRFGEVPLDRKPFNIVADIERLNLSTGCRPLVDMDLGLSRCYEFWNHARS